MTRLIPLYDRILVQRVEETAMTPGGLFIPPTAQEKPSQGRVIAVGRGKVGEDGQVRPLDVKAGDTVLFGKYSGNEIKLDGQDFIIMREDDVLAVVETE
jgi:chaperonin GroES